MHIQSMCMCVCVCLCGNDAMVWSWTCHKWFCVCMCLKSTWRCRKFVHSCMCFGIYTRKEHAWKLMHECKSVCVLCASVYYTHALQYIHTHVYRARYDERTYIMCHGKHVSMHRPMSCDVQVWLSRIALLKKIFGLHCTVRMEASLRSCWAS